MKITKQIRREAKHLFLDCMVDGVLDEPRVRQAVAAVIARKPHGYLGVLAHFHRLVKMQIALRTAAVESPVPLPAELQAQVTQRLGQLYGKGLDISFAQNPALLGGLRIKVGSDVYDGSVKARLAALAESF
jgi:F-type H+-transporting ATPase subunit delta